MKKFYILLIISALFLITCKKLPELKIYNLEISEETVTTTTSNATISAKYSFPTEIYEIKVLVNTVNDMDNANSTVATIENNVLTATIDNLSPSTYYYYCFRYSNGINLVDTDVQSFTTQDAGIPSLTTIGISNIALNSATSGGNITSDGGASITARGVCWSTEPNPTINNSYTFDGTGIGEFVSNLTGLASNTTYYVRAYAKNYSYIAYGNEHSFTTIDGLATVFTKEVTNITSNSAASGGNITSDGGASITARGVCWSTEPNPTINNSYTFDGTGIGEFVSNLTGLADNTYYYIRAYATNESGTSYGEQQTFSTLHETTLPIVTTSNVSSITQTSAVSGGNVTSDGYGVISGRGVCWSLSENPTINDAHTSDGSEIGVFISNINDLIPNTIYYIRAYATNEVGTSYGSQKTFTTKSEIPIGAINGVFSVSTTRQVCFSKGNLQYKASTNSWRFAENQYDCIGVDNTNISQSYSGWIDLFGWGTSGYNHGSVCYHPWNWFTGNGSSDYYAYGNAFYNLYDQTGQADWGYNAISNGGGMENQWRTLKESEWIYVLNTRQTISGIRFAKAKVNGINGVILLPDNWDTNIYNLYNTNTYQANYNSNSISFSEWETILEANGAVFLPAAGSRDGKQCDDIGNIGYYWSSSNRVTGTNTGEYATIFYFSQDDPGYGHGVWKCVGCSVRLVQDY